MKPKYIRFVVVYVDKLGECRSTEVTANNKLEAASKVSILGRVVSVDWRKS